jgi:CheY-like chemotaxis protein
LNYSTDSTTTGGSATPIPGYDDVVRHQDHYPLIGAGEPIELSSLDSVTNDHHTDTSGVATGTTGNNHVTIPRNKGTTITNINNVSAIGATSTKAAASNSNSNSALNLSESSDELTAKSTTERGSGYSHYIQFKLTDTGIGIAADDIPRLFNVFGQLDQTNTRRYQGTGLGLVICQKLVRLMSGEIEVFSDGLSKGTTVIFNIVAEPCEPTANQEPDADNELILTQLRGLRVLVVDDSEVNRLYLFDILSQWKMVPLLCSSGKEAIGYLRNNEVFDIGLIDMNMPVMTGVQLCQEIGKLGAKFPLIALSSIGEVSGIDRHCFTEYLIKPVKTDHLLQKMYKAIAVNGLVSITTPPVPSVAEAATSASRKSSQYGRRKSKRSSSGGSTALAPRTNLPILIAEDIEMNQLVIREMLTQLGYYNLTIVSNGKEAMQQIIDRKTDGFKILLLDIKMPYMSGLEVAQEVNRLYRDNDAAKPKMIAMTALAMGGDREYYIRKGHLTDYITKPIDIEQLKDVMLRATK